MSHLSAEILKYQVIRTLIDRQITDLIRTTSDELKRHRIGSVEAVRACPDRLIRFSDSMQAIRKPLKAFLWDHLYHHYRVVRMGDKAKRFISELFTAYLEHPDQLPNTTRLRIADGEEPARVICDYIAGMTDRYCQQEYQKLFGPFERV